MDPTHPNSRVFASPSGPLPPHVREFGFLPNVDQLQPGDLLLFNAINLPLISQAIVDVQLNGGYAWNDARWHHVAVYIGDYQLCEAQIISGVRVGSLFDYFTKYRIRIRRNQTISRDEQWQICVNALSQIGHPYSIPNLFKLWRQSKVGFSKPFQGVGDVEGFICSKLYSDSYTLATEEILVQGKIGLPTPADLSLTTRLDDVSVDWLEIPKNH
ncbi:MAG: hypothetical protein ACYDAM_11925 [Leptospirales bacterium]